MLNIKRFDFKRFHLKIRKYDGDNVNFIVIIMLNAMKWLELKRKESSKMKRKQYNTITQL